MRRRYRGSIEVAELLRIDGRIAALGRGLGAMRLRVGEGLLRLEGVGGVKALGFPNLESYCREALGRSGRWGSDVRGLARRLSGLPGLRAELVSGRLSTSMVELVARVATVEDEGEWIARALEMTVREMRAELKARRVETIDDCAPARVTVTATVDRIDAWAFEQARLMVESVGGVKGEAAIEAILAEGLTELIARWPGIDLPWGLVPEDEDERKWRAELAAIEETARAAVERLTIVEAAEYGGEDEIAWPEGVAAIDGKLREAARELAWRDLELGELGRRVIEHDVWKVLGYSSFEHYFRERVGLSPSSMGARVALAKRVVVLPEIEAAVVEGRIGYEAAAAIARVAGAGTVEAWIGRAEGRTVKVLREEIEAVEMIARAEGVAVEGMGPPDEAMITDVRDLERAVIAKVIGEESPESETEAVEVEVTMTGLRMSVGEEIGKFWRTLERLYGALGIEGSFVAFLVRAVMKAWGGAIRVEDGYRDVYVRERWRCASPVCRSRNVTPHHVVYRSRGGGEGRDNLVALCEVCHLELVHGGRLEVGGVAPGGLVWRAMGWASG